MQTKNSTSSSVQLPHIEDIGIKPYWKIESERANGKPCLPEIAHGLIHSAGAYDQQTTGRCNLVTFANCVFYHQGEWGGFGSPLEKNWAKSSHWFLAALSTQKHDVGVFWEDTLQHAGLISQGDRSADGYLIDGFRNNYLEYRRWPMNFTTENDWADTWARLQQYVKEERTGRRSL